MPAHVLNQPLEALNRDLLDVTHGVGCARSLRADSIQGWQQFADIMTVRSRRCRSGHCKVVVVRVVVCAVSCALPATRLPLRDALSCQATSVTRPQRPSFVHP